MEDIYKRCEKIPKEENDEEEDDKKDDCEEKDTDTKIDGAEYNKQHFLKKVNTIIFNTFFLF